VQGEQGVQGPEGRSGVQGERGEKGDHGDPGLRGPEGSSGIQGERGEKGDHGDQGIRGLKGDSGSPGGRGEKGDPGPQGEQGGPGPEGSSGIQGEPGEKGDQGNPGNEGIQGEPGNAAEVVFGSHYQSAESLSRETTNLATFKLKCQLTTPDSLSGTFRVGWMCVIDQKSTSDTVEARLQNVTDNCTLGAIQRHEPQDSDNRILASGFAEINFASFPVTPKIFEIQWRQLEGSTAGIQDARIEFWRVR